MSRFGWCLGFILLAITSTVSAQSKTAPIQVEAPALPSFRPPVKADASGIQISHPDELQQKLETIANELTAAGLAEEARVVLALRQRLQNEHRIPLATAYQKSLETQISMEVKIFVVTNEDEVNQAFARLLNQPTGDNVILEEAGHLSGMLPATDAKTVLDQLTKAKHLRVCTDEQFTILNGKTLRCLAAEPSPFPPGQKSKGTDNDSPELLGTSLVVSAKVIRDKMIETTLMAEVSSPEQQGHPSKLTLTCEVPEGQMLINDRVRAWEKEITHKRGPAWANIPGVIKLIRYQTSENVSRKLLVTVTPEIIKLNVELLSPVIEFSSKSSFPVEPAPSKPRK